MSEDFIDKMRRESAEKAKQPEPWVIERQKEDERRARNAAIGKQYLHESGCVAYAEKLEAFLKSQDSSVNAFWSIDSRYLREDEGTA